MPALALASPVAASPHAGWTSTSSTPSASPSRACTVVPLRPWARAAELAVCYDQPWTADRTGDGGLDANRCDECDKPLTADRLACGLCTACLPGDVTGPLFPCNSCGCNKPFHAMVKSTAKANGVRIQCLACKREEGTTRRSSTVSLPNERSE